MIPKGMYERTKQHNDNISKSRKQWYKTHTPYWTGKKRDLETIWNLDLHHSEETKKKISESCKRVGVGKWNKGQRLGHIAWNKGIPHTKEERALISKGVRRYLENKKRDESK